MDITVRSYDPEIDSAYIYSTWLKYSWYSPKEVIQLDKVTFFKDLKEKINRFLKEGETKVACLKQDPYVIIGYICVYEGKTQWVCIKKDFRHQGIEELLKNSMKGIIHEETESR